MDRQLDIVPYRAIHNRERLVYLTHPDARVTKALGAEFVANGLQVSRVPDLTELAGLLEVRRPDLVLLALCDEAGGVSDSLAALTAIRSRHLGIHAFLLAPGGVRAELVVRAMKHGASAVFSPPYAAVDIVDAAREIFRGDIQVAPGEDGADGVSIRGFGTLTHRERQVLQHVVGGSTNKEIAVDLGLSYRTVEVHRRHIMEKTGARNTAELVRLAVAS